MHLSIYITYKKRFGLMNLTSLHTSLILGFLESSICFQGIVEPIFFLIYIFYTDSYEITQTNCFLISFV